MWGIRFIFILFQKEKVVCTVFCKSNSGVEIFLSEKNVSYMYKENDVFYRFLVNE